MSSYHKDVDAPANLEIPGGLKVGHQIFIYGKVCSCEPRFAVNFKRSDTDCSDISLHFNPRKDQNTVVRNTYYNGCWQHEERDIPNFPFGSGEEFCIHIKVTACSYIVYVNNEYYITYNHREEVSYQDMCYLNLTTGADYHEVIIREPCRIPYSRALPRLTEGMSVRVRGLIHTDASRSAVNFMCDDGRCAFHCNPRQDQSDTVFNSKDHWWGPEERGFCYFPFGRGEFFDLQFIIQETKYIVFVNGKHLADYNHRIPLDQVTTLTMWGDVDLMDIAVYDQLLNEYVKPIPGGLRDGDMISVQGFFKPCVDRFAVNLLSGLDAGCAVRALHINPRRGANQVVLNNTVCNSTNWQTEVRYPLPCELKDMTPFCVDIVNTSCGFDVYMNRKKVGTFPHREPVANIQAVYCTQDAYYYSIDRYHKLPNPHSMVSGGRPPNGAWLSVKGIPYHPRFAIDIKDGSEPQATACANVLFHYDPRFSEGGVTVRNSLINGVWGCEERAEDSFPFSLDEIFEVNMVLKACDYKTVANGKHHIDYNHRVCPDSISHVITRLDADYYVKECY